VYYRNGTACVSEHAFKIIPARTEEQVDGAFQFRPFYRFEIDLFPDVVEIGLAQVGVFYQTLLFRLSKRHNRHHIFFNERVGPCLYV
jgi:hypothetical protein